MNFFRLIYVPGQSSPTVQECSHHYCNAPIQVLRTHIRTGVLVSTVFLGVAESKDTVFETMVFGGYLSQCQIRCGAWSIAHAAHSLLCVRVREVEQVLDDIAKKLRVC